MDATNAIVRFLQTPKQIKMKKLISIIAIMFLLFSGCTRFEHRMYVLEVADREGLSNHIYCDSANVLSLNEAYYYVDGQKSYVKSIFVSIRTNYYYKQK